jgi:hypothetical protein
MSSVELPPDFDSGYLEQVTFWISSQPSSKVGGMVQQAGPHMHQMLPQVPTRAAVGHAIWNPSPFSPFFFYFY